MNEHIEAAIREIEARIRNLQLVVASLREVFPAAPELEATPRAYKKRTKGAAIAPRNNGKSVTVVQAMRECIRALDNKFSAQELRDRITEKYPVLAEKLDSVSVNLIDMANRGELHREGAGRTATYRRAKLKPAKGTVESDYRAFRATIPAPASNDS